MTELPVDPTNAESARAWDGEDGAHWVRYAANYDESVAFHHRNLMKASEIAANDRVLDVGCGTGQTTRDAARLASGGHAHGVDLSAAMLEHAERVTRAEGIRNATFEQADAQVHRFQSRSFDIAISRTGAMFFGDPVVAFANIASALADGGRLVLLVWQAMTRNEWVWEFTKALSPGQHVAPPPPGAPGPFALADPERVRAILGAAGFGGVRLDPSDGPMYFAADAAAAYAWVTDMGFTKWRLSMLDETDRPRALEALRSTLAAHATAEGVVYDSAAWVVTATKS